MVTTNHPLTQRSSWARLAVFLLVLALIPREGIARKVICVDDLADNFVTNNEGYYRSIMQAEAGDVIRVGGNLTDCLALVRDGDELIIISHGVACYVAATDGNQYGFEWGGNDYFAFGAGGMPVPPGFNTRRNVTVTYVACLSADTGTTGTQEERKPFVQKLVEALGGNGNGNRGTGFRGVATGSVVYSFEGKATQQEIKDALKALKDDSSWDNLPPASRGVTPNQESAAQAIVDAKIGAGKLTVVLTYRAPSGTTGNFLRAAGDGLAAAPVLGLPRESGLLQPASFQQCTLSCGEVNVTVEDTSSPDCVISNFDVGPPATLEITVQDGLSGLATIQVTKAVNATMGVPSFSPGTTEPLVVTAVKIDPRKRAVVMLQVSDGAGHVTTCDPVVATLDAAVPETFSLAQNQPNPFEFDTAIRFALTEPSHVRLTVHDLLGRAVATLVDEAMEPGTYSVLWDGVGESSMALASGTYLYRLTAGSYTETKTMTLVR